MTDSRQCLRKLACALPLALLPAVAGAQWYWQRPRPQPQELNSVAASNANVGLAVGIGGSIVRTTDGGATWSARDSHLARDMALQKVRFTNATTAYAMGATAFNPGGPQHAIVVRSTDSGATWTTRASLDNMFLLDFVFADALHGSAVGTAADTFAASLLTTSDGGATWSVHAFDYLGYLSALTFPTPTAGFAVGVDLGNAQTLILHTVDGGANWAQQNVASDKALNGVAFSDASHGIAVGDGGAIFTTDDAGTTWTAHESGTELALFQVAIVAPHTIVVAGGDHDVNGVILRSTDDGVTWTSQTFDRSIDSIAFVDANVGTAVGNVDEILRTMDGGVTWTEQTARTGPEGLLAVSFATPRVGTAVGGVGVIQRTTDGGNNWFAQNSGTESWLYGLATPDEKFGVAVGGDSIAGQVAIISTEDGGETWKDQTPADLPRVQLQAVACLSAGVCTAVGDCGMIVHTDDGATWQVQRPAACASQESLYGVTFVDALHGTAVGVVNILSTADGGATWTVQAPPAFSTLRTVKFTDPNHGFIGGGGEFGTILHTVDGGLTWSVQRDDFPTPVLSLDFSDAVHGIAVTLDGEVYKTENAGTDWQLEASVGANFFGVAAFDASTAVAVGYSRGTVTFARSATPTFPIGLNPTHAGICTSANAATSVPILVTIDSALQYSGSVALSVSGLPEGSNAVFASNNVSAPAATTLTLSLPSNTVAGNQTISVRGNDGAQEQFGDFRLTVVDPTHAPTLATPADAAIDVPLTPTLTWNGPDAVQSFELQIARDSAFANVLVDAIVDGSFLRPDIVLNEATHYFWRVRGTTVCNGAWSATYTFTTADRIFASGFDSAQR